MSEAASTAALWERFSGDLRRWFGRRGVSPDVADDLLQETFLRVHQNGDTLTDEDRVAAWVHRVARNVLVDHRRRGALPGDEGVDVPDEGVDVPDEEPEDDVQATVAGWLPGYVRELPEAYREAVELHELEGLTHAEIAARTGLSVSGVKSRVQRGRERVRAALLQCCAFEFDRRGGVTDWNRKRGADCDDC